MLNSSPSSESCCKPGNFEKTASPCMIPEPRHAAAIFLPSTPACSHRSFRKSDSFSCSMWFCGPGVQVRRALQYARRSCMRPLQFGALATSIQSAGGQLWPLKTLNASPIMSGFSATCAAGATVITPAGGSCPGPAGSPIPKPSEITDTKLARLLFFGRRFRSG